MKTTILEKNKEQLSTAEFLEKFRTELETTFNRKSEIEELTDLMAKNPVDKFIISEKPEVPVCQGDLLIWSELTDEFKENFKKVTITGSADNNVLQEDDSITGDHELVPLSNAKYTLETGTFIPSILEGRLWGSNQYSCKILTIDSPFVVKHREHGNITFLTPGTYMICSSLDSETLSRMRD